MILGGCRRGFRPGDGPSGVLGASERFPADPVYLPQNLGTKPANRHGLDRITPITRPASEDGPAVRSRRGLQAPSNQAPAVPLVVDPGLRPRWQPCQRYNDVNDTILTCNLGTEELAASLGPSIVSRMEEGGWGHRVQLAVISEIARNLVRRRRCLSCDRERWKPASCRREGKTRRRTSSETLSGRTQGDPWCQNELWSVRLIIPRPRDPRSNPIPATDSLARFLDSTPNRATL